VVIANYSFDPRIYCPHILQVGSYTLLAWGLVRINETLHTLHRADGAEPVCLSRYFHIRTLHCTAVQYRKDGFLFLSIPWGPLSKCGWAVFTLWILFLDTSFTPSSSIDWRGAVPNINVH